MFRAHVLIIRRSKLHYTASEHMCSKHVGAWNKLILKQKFCASSWLITEINILRCTVNKTSKLYFIYNKNCVLSGRFVSIFMRSSSGPLRKQIQELFIFQSIVGSQMLTYCVAWFWNFMLAWLGITSLRGIAYWNGCSRNILEAWILCSCTAWWI